jgi:RNA polymerase sigma factor (TIGR02999 family)
MTIFRTPVPGTVIPAKAGIHCQYLNRRINMRQILPPPVLVYTRAEALMAMTEPPQAESSQFSSLLKRMGQGDRDAAGEAVSFLYDELHRIAGERMRREWPGHVLQTTALINEAYLRLVGAGPLEIRSRRHFIALASEQMRRVLVDYARGIKAVKRGGAAIKVALDDAHVGVEERSVDVVALDEALDQLHHLDPRAADIVMYRYFGGYTEDEVAEALAVSLITVRRDWEFARSWLYDRMSAGSG